MLEKGAIQAFFSPSHQSEPTGNLGGKYIGSSGNYGTNHIAATNGTNRNYGSNHRNQGELLFEATNGTKGIYSSNHQNQEEIWKKPLEPRGTMEATTGTNGNYGSNHMYEPRGTTF